MKCVKLINTGEVKRVSNEQAERVVKLGTHVFCPKSEWKALRAVPVVETSVEEQKVSNDKISKPKKETKVKKYMNGVNNG